MNIKPGVILHMRPCLVTIISVAQAEFAHESVECFITAGIDGKHMPNSKHYSAEALDFRTRHLPRQDEQAAMIAARMNKSLGKDYDVIAEANHIHAEYDPK